MFNRLLFKQIDNSALIVFRVFFGLLIALESFGAILTGWVREVLVEPEINFTFIGFEWLQGIPGNGLYLYYILMGICGVFVMFGYRYRLSIITFTILWTGTYLMQKSSYNNHYYLLILLSVFMSLVPANAYYSLDSKKHQKIRSIKMSQWCSLLFILQIAIVYTYASVAKMYPDWLDTTVVEILMKSKKNYYLIGEFLQQKWVHYFIAYSGIVFDLLVVPLLLWKPTRKYAFMVSVGFHLFNSVVFQIGIFPYMSIALCLFFFEPKTIRKVFLKKKELYRGTDILIPNSRNLIVSVFACYFIIQTLLPLRHWTITDNVLWTEEGHKLSWRMMLRVRQGVINFRVVDDENNQISGVNLKEYLTTKQRGNVATKPDMIWQFAQYLKQKFKTEQNINVAVYANSKISVNGRPFQSFINSKIDLASLEWNAFKHSNWILPSKLD